MKDSSHHGKCDAFLRSTLSSVLALGLGSVLLLAGLVVIPASPAFAPPPAASFTLGGTPVTSGSGNAFTVSLAVPTLYPAPTGSVTITDNAGTPGSCTTTPSWFRSTINSPTGYDTYIECRGPVGWTSS